jgi:hypothetical protein
MNGQTFDLSGFLAVPSSVKLDYQHYWNTFNRIQAYNSNISTIRSGGERGVTYYSFANYDELASFTQGQYLHVQRYPNSNWATVSKD